VRSLIVRCRRHRQIDQMRGERELARLALRQRALDYASDAARSAISRACAASGAGLRCEGTPSYHPPSSRDERP
jgi:hypothetical protein